MQTAIALLIVFACAAYVAWQLLRTLRAGNGKAGACCTKGCGDASSGTTTNGAATNVREQFISSDSLRRKRT